MNAAGGFSASLAQIEALIAADVRDPAIDPRCLPVVRAHPAPVRRAVVLFHGFTNCPRQFAALAELLFAAGFNVFVPRIPRHGLRDKLTGELAALTIEELIACAENAADLAAALGDEICVLGLSLGATMAAWLAQTRYLQRAVIIAPFFSIAHVPGMVEPLVAGALALAPNLELWWDPRAREAVGPDHGYPRFATHALAQCLQLGERIRSDAQTVAPLSAHTTLVLNAKDPAIDNGAAHDVLALWAERGAATDTYTFTDLDERHDIIEPQTYPDAARLVYPVLLDILTR